IRLGARSEAISGSGRQQALLPQPSLRLVDGLAIAREQVADLRLVDDERRTDRQRVAERSGNQSMLLRARDGIGTDRELGVEGLLSLLVLDQLDAANQADATNLANQRMLGKLAQAALKRRRDAADLGQNVALLVDLQGLDCDRRAHGMTAVGVAMAESADLGAVVTDDPIDLLVDEEGG